MEGMSMRDQTGTDSGTASVEVRYDPNLMNDLMITCREGGSNYWAVLKWEDNPNFDDDDDRLLYVQEVIDDWVSPVEYGVEVFVGKRAMWRAMQRIVHPSFKGLHRDYKRDIAGMLLGQDVDWDVWHADAILQVAVFGEVVYG